MDLGGARIAMAVLPATSIWTLIGCREDIEHLRLIQNQITKVITALEEGFPIVAPRRRQMKDEMDQAACALRDGDLVVYPTETVYGLGADGLNPTAVKKLFEVKNRPKDNPISLAFPTVDSALDALIGTVAVKEFMREFLPGPVTVIAEPAIDIPELVTAGKDVLGVRVPDNDTAKTLLTEIAPITATSANLSGRGSIRNPAHLNPRVKKQIAVILDTGDTPGGESTVINPNTKEILRHGLQAEQIKQWIEH